MKRKGDRSKARIKQRQGEAVQRQEVYDKRTHQQQLELIKTRPGESKKEKHRLVELIKKSERKKK
ncbi:hypothetical protein HOE22_07950 [Candidatus Woesearchaeota archaeon]|jgi:hypothetical protein|nr:hypothetical protein [Candidatus Woesearchaeota archaeon]MBT7557008.1 hypothetical protein [Candidatus Woesearchaeota archaeon]